MKNSSVIWEDKKRILGQPISFTKYSISGNKFYKEKGLLHRNRDVLMLYRIIDTRMSQTLWQRLFGVGTIVLMTNDKSHPELTVESVKEPFRVMDLINDLVEEERKKQGIRTTEIMRYDYGDEDVFGH